ncbi:helix-turn-helix transcriptional regulator [Acaryochloris sp. IP29b_bin.148]|uniref:response regulator transcription factor n=1 Tax=Acaryochloris sp. IP29b_bin.148 TaxID=2969218 RepID=UPI0026320C8D|nr:helix-turn-helix transcriptional regulator [Acaryochloris sp. IP29b_bin.148]
MIVIEKTIENRHIEKILNPYLLILDISHFSENTRFPIDDQLCILLEAKSSSSNSQLDIPKLLAEQELQIASLVAQGYLNKQIAKQLHISEWTAATPLHRIFAKLRVESGAAMVY